MKTKKKNQQRYSIWIINAISSWYMTAINQEKNISILMTKKAEFFSILILSPFYYFFSRFWLEIPSMFWFLFFDFILVMFYLVGVSFLLCLFYFSRVSILIYWTICHCLKMYICVFCVCVWLSIVYWMVNEAK